MQKIIIDNDIAREALTVIDDIEFGPVYKALFIAKRKTLILVLGGQLRREYGDTKKLIAFGELDRAGLAELIPDIIVDSETENIKALNLCKSNDQHVIALAKISGSRLLCTGDDKLSKDFSNKELLDKPRGKVYKDRSHKHLLTK